MYDFKNLDESIRNLSDDKILEFIDKADSWDEENVLEALNYLAFRYDVKIQDDLGNWLNSDDVLDEIKAKIKIRKWVVITGYKFGDDFSEVCDSKEEAEKKAEAIFSHLTESEKEKQYLSIAEMDIDQDGCPVFDNYSNYKEWL